MAKGDFWFPLFYQKLLTSTIGWKDDQFGGYIKLLIYQYDKGFVPNDITEIGRISQAAKKHWNLISKKFEETRDGNLINPIMYEIRQKRLRVSKTNSENGSLGGRPKKETEVKPNGYENGNQYNNDCDFISEIENFGKSENLSEKELSPIVLEAVERNQFSHTGDRNTLFVKDQWEIFLIERSNDRPIVQKQNQHRLGEYFLNWMRNKFPKHGTAKNRGIDSDKPNRSKQQLDNLKKF